VKRNPRPYTVVIQSALPPAARTFRASLTARLIAASDTKASCQMFRSSSSLDTTRSRFATRKVSSSNTLG